MFDFTKEFKLEGDSVPEIIQGLAAIARMQGKRPKYVILSADAHLRFKYEMEQYFKSNAYLDSTKFDCKEFCGLAIIVMEIPEIFIRLGYDP